ncbi:5'-3' exoribonuclease 2 [Blyttiomyces sp. JEL0837]|nr:5'-3' exoribonuclease 2 [Blyttiomyces sp. JEL0837]
MGIPALFRWLSTKYPRIASTVVEEKAKVINGVTMPIDVTKPNPNNTEFDNLYLDMNGIIHPCCHPEDKPAPSTEDEMMVEIFKYIDRIMTIIRPRKVLYMAIDGVAPRAKMNQQRSRRFRASQEAAEKAVEEERIRKDWEKDNYELPASDKKVPFDSNCITPGTPFMANLALALRYYIADRLNSDPGWRNLKVFLSDASVPGEGEHKIMDYVRRQRVQPEYDPMTSHVLYGLDADLIMLALATHEPYFKILREDVFFNQNNSKGCFICGQSDHQASECTGKKKEKSGEFDEKGTYVQRPYVFLHVNVLREYLEAELKVSDLPFPWDLERAIDDWVFLCFFVGNDFLPHLPSLEIREGAIDKLIAIWKRNLINFGGYLTDSGDIDLYRVQILLVELGELEDEIFQKRREEEERKRRNKIRRKQEEEDRKKRLAENREGNSRLAMAEAYAALPMYSINDRAEQLKRTKQESVNAKKGSPDEPPKGALKIDENKAAADALKRSLLGLADAPMTEAKSPALETTDHKRKADDIEEPDAAGPSPKKLAVEPDDSTGEPLALPVDGETAEVAEDIPEEAEADADADAVEDDDEEVEETLVVADVPIEPKKVVDDDEEPEDNVRLWESGWKKRYYDKKFGVSESDRAFIREVVTKYVEGFCWVLKYYYQGVQSWKWFFPYHYSPFASDFDFIGELTINFELGEPFRPIEQLMGVLPAASRKHIPEVFHPLMLEDSSPIIDFYPEKFPIDMNGKKYLWQGVALLPFIEESRLIAAMEPIYAQLTEEETFRNTKGNEVLCVGKANRLFEPFCAVYAKRSDGQPIPINPKLSDHVSGSILPDAFVTLPGSTFYSPLESQDLPDLPDNQSISVFYLMPQVPRGFVFHARLLPSVQMPPRELSNDDIMWIKMGGSSMRGRGRGRGRGGQVAQRFIRHGIGASDMPYMGGGGYDVSGSNYTSNYNDNRANGGGYNNNYNNNNYNNNYNNNGRYNNQDSSYGGGQQSDSWRGQGQPNRGGGYRPQYNNGSGSSREDTYPPGTSRPSSSGGYLPSSSYGSSSYGSSSYGSSSYGSSNYGSGSYKSPSYGSPGSYGRPAPPPTSSSSRYSGSNLYGSDSQRPPSSYGSLYNSAPIERPPGTNNASTPQSWMSEIPGANSILQGMGASLPLPPRPNLAWNRNLSRGASGSGSSSPRGAGQDRGGRGGRGGGRGDRGRGSEYNAGSSRKFEPY